MTPFKSLFGIEKEDIQHNCLLLPFLPPGVLDNLGIKKLSRGFVFSAGNVNNLTVINTGMGAGLTGDACLYLEKSKCANIIFFGSCGLVNPHPTLGVGSLILPSCAYAYESFSDILNNRLQSPFAARPDQTLIDRFCTSTSITPHRSNCISFASLHEEEKFIPLFNSLNAEIIEMECAALFLAAAKINIKAMALLYISDILQEKRFYEEASSTDKKNLTESISQACHAFLSFVKSS